ncbi:MULTISPECIES: flavodoxin family protein [unclassified Streptomyces]|uniref:flavodoxin family protein n=1 Tax=unclassified Streptomyces TaxID=2593676 RepID=UPI000373E967|nr:MULTISPECIES: flavodoxin family protein [unclassified Streptomyces]MYT31324.1 flavodoxin [Streptomyces sp. SID8354]
MKTILVCTSVSHGNTKRIADAMGQVLEAPVVAPEEVDVAELAACDLVGFGSGIFLQKFHPRLSEFVRSLPAGNGRRAFVYATSGLPELPFRPFTRPLVRDLRQKGFVVDDIFSCRARDTWLPFKLVGGINNQRPDGTDLAAACTFAEGLRARIGTAS